MNILKTYDFPVATRTEKGIITESAVKEYFKKHKNDKALIKFANFYFLIYLAKILDIAVNNYLNVFRLLKISDNK